jgi:radical SAM-linked protein
LIDAAQPQESVTVSAVKPADEEELTRVRLWLSKSGRARMVAHLEYLGMFQRAVRRAGLPIRYSGGFHPKPKISYLEALPMGVASEAELIDLELIKEIPVDLLKVDLNVQLPSGFKITEGRIIPWKSPSPSASVASSRYRVPLPKKVPADLAERIINFLDADKVLVTRIKKQREEQIDLRPNVLEISRVDNELELSLVKGSPLQVAAYLFEMDIEAIRRLQVRKIGIILKDSSVDVASDDAPAAT